MSAGFVTAADLQQQLGGIPLERIRLVPPPGSATDDDALRVQDAEGRTCEVIDGVLVEKAMGFNESYIAAALIQLLKNFVDKHDLGIVTGPDGLISLQPGRTRAPDVSFFGWNKFPQRRLPKEPVPHLTPDLAVEVLSRGNTREEIERKLDEYFANGVDTVWVIQAARKTATIYESRNEPVEAPSHGIMTAPRVLPGFELAMAVLFDRAG